MSSSDENKLRLDYFVSLIVSKAIFKKEGFREALIASLFIYKGLKPKDLLLLTKYDLKNLSKELYANKFIQKALFDKKDTDLLFTTTKNKPLTIRRVQQLVKALAQKYTSSFDTPSKLRKYYLSQILSKETSNLNELTGLKSLSKRETLSKQEFKKLHRQLQKESKRDQLLILTLLETGIRIQELLLLKRYNLQNNKLSISSDIAYNNKRRSVPLSKKLFQELYQQKTEYLFTTNRNDALTTRRFEQVCAEIGNKISLSQLTPSLLRNTAVALLSKSYSLDQLQQQVGLSSDILYTHGLNTLPIVETDVETTAEIISSKDAGRKDNEKEFSASSMYWRTRTRRGGGDKNE